MKEGGPFPFRSVYLAGRRFVCELLNDVANPAPSRGALVIALATSSSTRAGAFVERHPPYRLSISLAKVRDIDLGYHAGQIAGLRSRNA